MALTAPLRLGNRWADRAELQDGDLLARVYELVVIAPLKLLGRILWITVDFLVIERSVIGSISAGSRFLIGSLQHIQKTVWLNYLFMLLLGLAVMLFNIGYYYYG